MELRYISTDLRGGKWLLLITIFDLTMERMAKHEPGMN